MEGGKTDIAIRKETELCLRAEQRHSAERSELGALHLLADSLHDGGRHRTERVGFIVGRNVPGQTKPIGKYNCAGANSGQATDMRENRLRIQRLVRIEEILEGGSPGGSGCRWSLRHGLHFCCRSDGLRSFF